MSHASGGYAILLVETADKKLKLYGCPSGRGDLENADEVIEINGRCLDNCSHEEIADYVRRRGVPLAASSATGAGCTCDPHCPRMVSFLLEAVDSSIHIPAFAAAIGDEVNRNKCSPACWRGPPLPSNSDENRCLRVTETTATWISLPTFYGYSCTLLRVLHQGDRKNTFHLLNSLFDHQRFCHQLLPTSSGRYLNGLGRGKASGNRLYQTARNCAVKDTFAISVSGGRPPEASPSTQGWEHVDMTQLAGGPPTNPQNHHSTPNVHVETADARIHHSSSLSRLPKNSIGNDTSPATSHPREEKKALDLQLSTENNRYSPSTSNPNDSWKAPAEVISKDTNSSAVTTSDVKLTSAPSRNHTDPIKMAAVQGAVRHREMAVDVPDSFVAVTKTAPRYPPPRKNGGDTSSLKKNGLYYFSSENTRGRYERSSQEGSDGSRRTPPTPRISELMRDNSGINQAGDKKVASNGDLNHIKDAHSFANGIDSEHAEKIKKYKEDLRRRKEEEERHAQEEEFLRSSLRGSKKLQALEKEYKSGVENSAFQLEEGDAGLTDPSISGKLVSDAPEDEPLELSKTYDSTELLNMVHNIEACIGRTEFDSDFVGLEKLLHNEEFQSMLSLHNKVQEVCCFKCPPAAVCADAQDLSLEVNSILENAYSKNAKELIEILSKAAFENMLIAHDKIAISQATPEMTAEEELLTKVSQYTEESIKIVRIDKTTEPLGATVKNEGEAVIIGRIVKGGVAEKSGLLHEGDEILEVNGIEMRGKSVNDVCDIMAGMSGTLTFLIVPSQYESQKSLTRESVIHLKAHFDYEPDDDLYIPCRELGMSFQKGDVLHVIGQDDPNWWQAYREGEEDQMLAGLIPSKSFQQQREVVKQAVVVDIRERKSKKGKFLCARKPHKRKKRKLHNLTYSDENDTDQILTYEEVSLYYPRAYHKRPLVLIGPQKVGRHELRQRLMEDTNRFAAAVPHTSRSRKDGEVNGADYHFISRTQFEADILAGKFVEHGEYQKSYYGTSINAIRSVINAGKTCVLNLHPQSLKILKKSDLKPYVVFIAPPSLEKLRQNCLKTDNAIKDEELKDIIEKAREMEEYFGHYFDLVLINVDIEKTYSELLHEISVIEREPQWVPAIWMNNETH